jgi:ZIP family zinc transporter
MQAVWISALALCLASIIGSLIGLTFKGLSHKTNDIIMGFCAGIMLAASVVGLILPATDMATSTGWWQVAIGVLLGAIFLNLLDNITPHLHRITGLEPESHNNNAQINKVLLFVLAIALHKLPEGIAAGVSFNNDSESAAWSVTLGLALQNIPEGMVVISPLLLAGVNRWRTFFISLAIGLLEIIGVWIGYGLGAISIVMLPIMLAFAGGAMLYVISDEMIPETHAHGYHKAATFALLIGFMTLVFLEGAM